MSDKVSKNETKADAHLTRPAHFLADGITRRRMLMQMGLGAAATAWSSSAATQVHPLATPPIANLHLTDYTPQVVWQYQTPAATSISPVAGNGAIFYASGDLLTARSIVSIDTQTTKTIWSYDAPGPAYSRLALANQVLYAADAGGNLYALDSVTGSLLWQRSGYVIADKILVVNGKLIFATTDTTVRVLDTQGNPIWSSEPSSGSPALAVSGNVLVIAHSNQYLLQGVDLNTGTQLWTCDVQYPMGGPLAVGEGKVYVLCNEVHLTAVDAATGQLQWGWPAEGISSDQLLSCNYYNGAVYTFGNLGNVSAINAKTGATLWRTQLNDSPHGTVLIDDGVAYVAGSSNLFAIDLASQGQDVVSYASSWTPSLFYLETGVAYYWLESQYFNTPNLGAINLAGLLHQFFAESELIVEGYSKDATTGATQGNSTSFRTHVQLVDPNKNPRSNKSIKIRASGPVTISSRGRSYDIDAPDTGKAAWLLTDGLGEISIVARATGLLTPALYLWGNFMALNEAIVVYPDHDSLNKLSGVQGSDLQSATSYSGAQILPSSYTNTADLASTIRNTIGGTQASLTQTQQQSLSRAVQKGAKPKPRSRNASSRRFGVSTGVTATTYIAYPGSTTNMLFQPVAGSADRAYVAGGVAQWTATFGVDGGVSYSAGVTLTPKQAKQLKPDGTPRLGSIFGSFEDFVSDVVNGARTIGSIVWSVGQTIYNDLGEAYQFVVSTVEQAVALVTGILKTVINDIGKAIEWLSYLFDWSDMLSVKDQLKAKAQAGFNNLNSWISGQLNAGSKGVNGFFATLEQDVQSALSQASNLLGSSTLQSKQQNGNNPQKLYGAGGAKSYTKSRWLMTKFSDNAASGSVGVSASFRVDSSDPILSVVDQLISDVGTIITNSSQFGSIPADLQAVFTNFGTLAVSPSDFVTRSFGDIINLISDIITSLLQLAGSIVTSLMNALAQIIGELLNFVNLPLQIPGVSDLYSLITGGAQLTVLDLCCLLIAVPTTIVQKALSLGSSRPVTEPSDARSLLGDVALNVNIGYLFASACYAILDPLMDLTDSPLPLKFGYFGISIILQGLNFPTDLASNSTGDYFFYGALAIPVVMTAVDIKQSLSGESGSWELLAPTIDIFYGIVMLGTSIGLGILNTKYQGTDYLLMIQNIFTFIPFIAKPLGTGGNDEKIALSIIDGACDVTALGLSTAQVLV